MCGARNGRRQPTGLPAPGGDNPGDRTDVAGSAGTSLTRLCKPRVRFVVTGWSQAEWGGWRGVAGPGSPVPGRAGSGRGGGARRGGDSGGLPRRPPSAGVGARAAGTRCRTGTGAPPVPAPPAAQRCGAVRCAVACGCGWVIPYVPVRVVWQFAAGAAALGEAVVGIGWPGPAGQRRAAARRGRTVPEQRAGAGSASASTTGRTATGSAPSGGLAPVAVCGAESGCGGAGAGCGGGPGPLVPGWCLAPEAGGRTWHGCGRVR